MIEERNPRREFFLRERGGGGGIVGRDDAKTVLGGSTEE
jgi:hypothetical protein